MKRPVQATLVALALVAFAAAAAFAAAPRKGGEYRGRISQTSARLGKGVIVKVSGDGRTARAAFSCGKGRGVSGLEGIKIADGRFMGVRRVGSVKLWSIEGHFISGATLKARLRLYATCDAHGARLTLKLQG